TELRSVNGEPIPCLAGRKRRQGRVSLGDVLHERHYTVDASIGREQRLIHEVDAMVLEEPVAVGIPPRGNVGDRDRLASPIHLVEELAEPPPTEARQRPP